MKFEGRYPNTKWKSVDKAALITLSNYKGGAEQYDEKTNKRRREAPTGSALGNLLGFFEPEVVRLMGNSKYYEKPGSRAVAFAKYLYTDYNWEEYDANPKVKVF